MQVWKIKSGPLTPTYLILLLLAFKQATTFWRNLRGPFQVDSALGVPTDWSFCWQCSKESLQLAIVTCKLEVIVDKLLQPRSELSQSPSYILWQLGKKNKGPFNFDWQTQRRGWSERQTGQAFNLFLIRWWTHFGSKQKGFFLSLISTFCACLRNKRKNTKSWAIDHFFAPKHGIETTLKLKSGKWQRLRF